MNLVRRLFPFRTCTIDIREGERALSRPCLLYHIKRCQGPCIEAIPRAAYRRDIAQVELFLEGNADTLLEGLAPRDARRVRGRAVREGGRRPGQDPVHRADDGEPEDGRLRPHGAGPRGDGPQGRPGRGAAVRRAQRQDAGPGRVLPRGPPRCPRRRGARPVPAPVLRPGHERPARGARPALRDRHRGPRGVPGRPAGERGPPPDPPAGREARADGPGCPQRRRVAGP